MPRNRVNLRELLPPTWAPVHAANQLGGTRWMIYDGDDNYRGDLTRERPGWHGSWPGQKPQELWTWRPYSEGTYVDGGTLDQCMEAIFQLAEGTDSNPGLPSDPPASV